MEGTGRDGLVIARTPTGVTLADLLRQAIDDRTGAPLREIQACVEAEEAARPRGMALNRSTASQILRGAYRGIPSAATVRAIAWLAGVSDEEAFAAAGRPAPGRPLAGELPNGADSLDHRERGVVVDVIRVLLAHRRDADERRTESLEALECIASDLERIHHLLDSANVSFDASQIISDATQQLRHATTRTRQLLQQLADEGSETSDAG